MAQVLAQADADKNRTELFFELLETHVPPDFRFVAKINTERFHHFDFAQRIRRTRFVRRDAIRAESSG